MRRYVRILVLLVDDRLVAAPGAAYLEKKTRA